MVKLEKRNATNLIYSAISLFFIALPVTLYAKWGKWNSGYELGLAVGEKFRLLIKDFVTFALIYSAIMRRREQHVYKVNH